MNLAFALASLVVAVLSPVPKGPPPAPMSPEWMENILVMATQECVAKREGPEDWCRARAETQLRSALHP